MGKGKQTSWRVAIWFCGLGLVWHHEQLSWGAVVAWHPPPTSLPPFPPIGHTHKPFPSLGWHLHKSRNGNILILLLLLLGCNCCSRCPCINFTNSLRAGFLYNSVMRSFSVITFCVCIFWQKEICANVDYKMLMKLASCLPSNKRKMSNTIR